MMSLMLDCTSDSTVNQWILSQGHQKRMSWMVRKCQYFQAYITALSDRPTAISPAEGKFEFPFF